MFSEAVVPRYTSLTLHSASGALVPLPAPRVDPASSNREYVAEAPVLRPGDYRVEWRAASADGHAITGSFAFTLLPAAAGPAPAQGAANDAPSRGSAPDSLAGRRVDPEALPPAVRPGSTLGVATRFLHFAAILTLIGAATFLGLLLPGTYLMPTVHFRLRSAGRRFAASALLLLLLALAARLWLESAALHGPDRALQPRLLIGLLTGLTWGQAWAAQVVMGVLAGLALVTGLTPLLALSALGLAFALPFQAHAAAVHPFRALAVAADGLHVLAAGAWIGTLAVMLMAALPALFRDGLERGGHDTARLLQRFSPLALAAAALLAAAGTASALLHFHSPIELVTTRYGLVLLLKLGIVALVLVTGWYNWKRVRPALPLHTGVRALRRAALLELLFAAAALGVTAILVALPTP